MILITESPERSEVIRKIVLQANEDSELIPN